MRQTVKQNMMTGPIELTGTRCVRPLKMVLGISAHTALGLGTGDGQRVKLGDQSNGFVVLLTRRNAKPISKSLTSAAGSVFDAYTSK